VKPAAEEVTRSTDKVHVDMVLLRSAIALPLAALRVNTGLFYFVVLAPCTCKLTFTCKLREKKARTMCRARALAGCPNARGVLSFYGFSCVLHCHACEGPTLWLGPRKLAEIMGGREPIMQGAHLPRSLSPLRHRVDHQCVCTDSRTCVERSTCICTKSWSNVHFGDEGPKRGRPSDERRGRSFIVQFIANTNCLHVLSDLCELCWS
jgi:hypothetical protein